MDDPTNAMELSRVDKRKQSLYFPSAMLEEIKAEALRQDRSLSWIAQRAWQLARDRIKQIEGVYSPSTDDAPEAESSPQAE